MNNQRGARMLAVVLDHDEVYSEVLCELLRKASFEATSAATEDSALGFARRRRPDLAVLDAAFWGEGLSAAIEALREARPALPILVLSQSTRQADSLDAFDAGTDDFLRKPFHPSELVARVRALTRRTMPADPRVAVDPRGLVLEPERRRASFDGNDLHCTAIEFAILRELAGVPGQVLSHRYLNQRIWSYPNLEDGTLLKNHVRNLRRKLADAGAPIDAIRSAHGVGYTLTSAIVGRPEGAQVTFDEPVTLEGRGGLDERDGTPVGAGRLVS